MLKIVFLIATLFSQLAWSQSFEVQDWSAPGAFGEALYNNRLASPLIKVSRDDKFSPPIDNKRSICTARISFPSNRLKKGFSPRNHISCTLVDTKGRYALLNVKMSQILLSASGSEDELNQWRNKGLSLPFSIRDAEFNKYLFESFYALGDDSRFIRQIVCVKSNRCIYKIGIRNRSKAEFKGVAAHCGFRQYPSKNPFYCEFQYPDHVAK